MSDRISNMPIGLDQLRVVRLVRSGVVRMLVTHCPTVRAVLAAS